MTTVTTEAASPGSTTSANPDDLAAFVSIDTCDNNGGSGTSSGTIENQGDSPTAYRIEVNFTDGATGAVLGSGSDETDLVAPGASSGWTVSADGIGDSEPTCHTSRIASASGDRVGTATTTAVDAFPCDLFTPAAIEKLTGNPLDGDATTNHITEDSWTWTAKTCTWSNFPATVSEPTEVTLNVARADGFESGTVDCPPLSNTAQAIDGLGTKASWSWTDPGTTITVGKLRVCAPNALVDVDVSGAGTEPTLQQIARTVAEAALAKA